MSNQPTLGQETLRHRLEETPANFQPHIKMGFHLLGRATEDDRQAFLRYMLTITERGKSLDRGEATRLIGLDENTITDVLSCIAMVIGSLVDNDSSADDFATFGRGVVFNPEDEAVVREVASAIVARRSSLHVSMSDAALANAVLPSFEGLSAEVDVRLRFEHGKDTASGAVVLAVCNLKTDATDDRWFQIKPAEVDRLIEKLQRLSKQLQAAQALASSLEQ